VSVRETIDALRDANERWSSDDARWWAEVLGVVLALGLTIRGGVHVWTALFANAAGVFDEEIDPHLADCDITLKSPVKGLREHRVERVARYATFVVGLVAWSLLAPLTTDRPPMAAPYIVLQVTVLFADPVTFLLDRLTNRLSTTFHINP